LITDYINIFFPLKDGVDSFTCDCVEGYTGNLCHTNIDDCDPNPCLHQSTCVVCTNMLCKRMVSIFSIQDGVNEYSCHCSDGYYGVDCETDNDECQSQPCSNNGTCTVRK